MEFGLTGKRVAVAAATTGLGYGCAEAFVAEGARVAICGSSRDNVERAAGQLGNGCVGLTHDLRKPASAGVFVKSAAQRLGGLDVLVINGPGPGVGGASTTTIDDHRAALEIIVLSAIRMCEVALESMRPGGWGRIIAITSISVRQPIANLILSNTARTGLSAYLKSLAREVASAGITVNSVQPGLHDTDRVRAVYGDRLRDEVEAIPVGRLGTARELGALVAFLASDQAGFITGAAVLADGGSYAGLF